MKIKKHKTYYLLSNEKGEYHIDIEQFESMGEQAAIELATKEIDKKSQKGQYTKTTIDYKRARLLGFCEYGIKDFCNRLKLDIYSKYKVSELFEKVDIHTFIEYPSECLKVFGDNLYDKFGEVTEILDKNRSRRALNCFINSGKIEDKILRELAYLSAMRVIHNFEKVYPNDDRPRKAIESCRLFNEGKIDSSAAESVARSAMSAAMSAAWSTARLAAWSATLSAESATLSTELATRSLSAAMSAAARSAELAEQGELNFQIDTLIDLLNKK